MSPPRDPANPPWFCEWRSFEANVEDREVRGNPGWPVRYDQNVLMWVSDHPPPVGDITAQGDRVLMVTGPQPLG
jgi:hypothetical protein